MPIDKITQTAVATIAIGKQMRLFHHPARKTKKDSTKGKTIMIAGNCWVIFSVAPLPRPRP